MNFCLKNQWLSLILLMKKTLNKYKIKMEGISGCFFKICLASCNSANNFANISRTSTAIHNLPAHSVTLRIVQSFLVSSSLPPGFWLQGVSEPACVYVDLYRLCDSRDVNSLYWFSFPLSPGVLLSQWCKHQAGWLCHFFVKLLMPCVSILTEHLVRYTLQRSRLAFTKGIYRAI